VHDRREPDRILQRLASLAPLRCVECGTFSGGDARKWRAYRIEEVELGELPELALYCPACAAEEFGDT
jgi:hypothetical protein